MLIVQKYGGSSLADSARIARAAQMVRNLVRAGHQVVAVVSAQGKTTDLLSDAAAEVNAQAELRELDAYLACGEQMSACLMAMALEKTGVSAVSLTGGQAGICTDDVHGSAKILHIDSNRIRRELKKGRVVVVAGFQGLNSRGDITTLGRGGSDTTAVALAGFLKADQCRIYTDVDGIYNKDPRKFPDAVKYDRITYDQMLALCRGGAQVLHDRSVELGKKMHIPIQVLSAFREGDGTVVTE